MQDTENKSKNVWLYSDNFITLPLESYNKTIFTMARKSKKSELRKQELISNVPVEQHKMIKQPITFAYLSGEMSVMHARIQTIIMEKLQLKIEKALRRKATDGIIGDLFDVEDYKPIDEKDTTPYLTFVVKYSELGVEPSNYKYVSEAARNMQGSLVFEEEKDGYVRSTVVFPVIDVPDEKKGERHTDIKLHMTKSMSQNLFTLTRYHKYLRDAVFLFSSGYTGRIYLLINANKELGTWSIEYEKLRRILLTTKDENGNYVVNKYRDINDFKKRVLEPAKEEIFKAADHIDCTFDYEFSYPEGKKRGVPSAVVFHIHLTDMGRNIKQAQIESMEAMELRNILTSLKVNMTDVKNLMKQTPPDKYSQLTAKARELAQLFADVKAGLRKDIHIDNPRAYTLTSLRNYIAELSEPVTEVKPEAPQPSHYGIAESEIW